MARLRKGKDPRLMAVPRLAAKKGGPAEDSGAANGEPHAVQRVVGFPKLPAADDVISDRVIFEVGDNRFAMKWTVEIERLPPAGPVAVERKKGPEEATKKELGLKQKSKDIVHPVVL